MEPCPKNREVQAWMEAHRSDIGPVVRPALENALVFDLSPSSPEIDDLDEVLDVPAFSARLFRRMDRAGAEVGFGRYGEPRLWYASTGYASRWRTRSSRRTR